MTFDEAIETLRKRGSTDSYLADEAVNARNRMRFIGRKVGYMIKGAQEDRIKAINSKDEELNKDATARLDLWRAVFSELENCLSDDLY